MTKYVLYTIVAPQKEGQNPKLYYVYGNHFSTNLGEAEFFDDPKGQEIEKVRKRFDFDLQTEKIENLKI